MKRLPSDRFIYGVQTRPARRKLWEDLPDGDGTRKGFKRHADAKKLAKTLTDRPDNRGHDDYYRVVRRVV